MNALAAETSPYLLQHCENPVEWLPWGEEAFRRARESNRPVFLSVGYSTCHWCHVMARESFEDPEIAALMNRYFVNVKVDREERPDVDRLYMGYVQAVTGSGGWPMSVWLTPDGAPFFGGTYFPPDDRYGRAGFPRVLRALGQAWENQREEILEVAGRAMAALALPDEGAAAGGGAAEGFPAAAAARASRQFEQSYDGEYGGFGGAPKFPRPAVFHFLLARGGAGREMALESLRVLCAAGIHDALGGGFHRYSVDRFWHVPHFEKMLYDQAQLVCALVEAWQLTGEGLFRRTALSTADYILRDLALPGGGLASAEDADSEPAGRPGEHAEGAFYVWTEGEIREVLTAEEAKVFLPLYHVRAHGNAPEGSDPHGELEGKNVLHARWEELVRVEGGPRGDLVRSARAKLFEARGRRPRPHRDSKVIAAWNGLAVSALARAGAAFGEWRLVEAAERVAGFLKSELWDGSRLYRSWRGRLSPTPGFAEDHAFVAAGLLDLYEATGAAGYLRWALELQGILDREFWDGGAGGYFTSGRDADPCLRARTKGDHDGAEPLAESVAAMNLLRFAAMGLPVPRPPGDVFASRGKAVESSPTAFPGLLFALELSLRAPRQAVITARPGAPLRREFLEALRSGYDPGLVILHAEGGEGSEFLRGHRPEFAMYEIPEEGARLYLCEDFACRAPLASPAELRAAAEPREAKVGSP